MSAERVPIAKNPGFWRRGESVCFKYRDSRRKQRWASASTIAAAKKLKAQLETDVARGELDERSRVTFASYARAWLDTYAGRTSKGLTEATRDDYRKRLEQDAIPFFGEMRLQDVRPLDLKEFAAHVAGRGVKPNTVRLALAPVKALFATAFEEGTLRMNPAAGIRIAQPREQLLEEEGDDEVKALTSEQLAALLAKLGDRRLFFRVLADLGLRIGEAVELRWRDVDLGAGTVQVRRRWYRGRVGPPKSRFGRRTLKLTPELARDLWELRKQTRAGDEELVFTAERGGRLDQSNLMSRVLKPAAVAAGIGELVDGRNESWVGFHTFRHTCATTLFRAGWNAKQVQLFLGHHKPSFTIDTYVHLLPSELPDPVAIAPGGTRGGTQTGVDDTSSESSEQAAEPLKQAVSSGAAI
jgi:integrase